MAGKSPHITWIASYPKSGNTWLRFVVFHLAHGRLPESSKELDRFANSKLPTDDDRSVRYCKTHAAASALASYSDRSCKAIYLYRHPLDVMQSALNYAYLTGELELASDPSAWITSFIAYGGNPLWFDPPFYASSWAENVSSWNDQSAFPVLALKYESLLRTPKTAISGIARFLGLSTDDADIDSCAQATSLRNLQVFEQEELRKAHLEGVPQGRFSTEARMKTAKSGVRFFNKGTVGSYRDSLSDAVIDVAWPVFRDAAEKLGYER